MSKIIVSPIGIVRESEGSFLIEVNPKFRNALQGIESFSHICVLWWFSECDNDNARNVLSVQKPYKTAPDVLGVFATRSPARPNPIALTTSRIINVDIEKGIIAIDFIDAFDGTPVLDIKPYTPSLDRVEQPNVPFWQSDWPMSREESGTYDWSQVFEF